MATVLLKQARLPRVCSFQIKNKIKPESFSCPSANSSESWQVDEVIPRLLRVRDSVCCGFWHEASPVESGSPQAAIYQEVHPHRLRYALFLLCFSALHRTACPSNLENVPLSPLFLSCLLSALLGLYDSSNSLDSKVHSHSPHCVISGVAFLLCLKLFPSEDTLCIRLLSASLPFLGSVYYALLLTGILKDATELRMMERTKATIREVFIGPFEYGLSISAIMLLFGKASAKGVTAIAVIACGYALSILFLVLFLLLFVYFLLFLPKST